MLSFLSFGDNPIVYLLLGYFLIGGIIYLSTQQQKRLTDSFFLFLSISVFLMLRLPVLFYKDALNYDEYLLVTKTITLQNNIADWKIAEISNGNFINSYLLIIPTFLGLHFTYQVAHFMAFLFSALALYFTFKTSQTFFGETTARLSFLVGLFFLSLTQDASFLHYSNELITVLLISVSSYLCSQITMSKQIININNVLFLSFLIAILCFEKIQLLPIAFSIFLFTFFELFRHYNNSFSSKLIQIVSLLLLFFPFVLLFISVNNLSSSINALRNLHFMPVDVLLTSSLTNINKVLLFVNEHLDFLWFCLPTIAIFMWFLIQNFSDKKRQLISFILGKKYKDFSPPKKTQTFLFIFSLFAMTLLAIACTNIFYEHYWHYMILPITLLNAYFIKFSGLADYAPNEIRVKWMKITFFSLTILPFLGLFLAKIITHQATNIYPSNLSNLVKHLSQ